MKRLSPKRLSPALLLAGALVAGTAAGAHAQAVTSVGGSYTVDFTESTTNVGGAEPFLYTYSATLVDPTAGAYVDSLAFSFANPNAYDQFTADSDSFAVVNETGDSILFAADSADPGLSAANPTATFSFLSAFAPTAVPGALAITPSGGDSAGPGPGVGNLFVGPGMTAGVTMPGAPEPGAWASLGLGALGLLALGVRARRAAPQN